MKKKNKGAISIFALLSMMFFLIFIMVAYNNVMQKGKTQVETEGILVDYYKSTRTAAEITSAMDGGYVSAISKSSLLRGASEKERVSNDNKNKYIFSNGKVYKIGETRDEEINTSIIGQYVTDNMLAMYDGKYNTFNTETGICSHNSSETTSWDDLVRRDGVDRSAEIQNFTINSNSYWVDNGIHLSHQNDDGIFLGDTFNTLFKDSSATIEMLLNIDNTGQRGILFGNYNQSSSINFENYNYNSTSGYQSRVYWNGADVQNPNYKYNLPYNKLITVTFCYEKSNNKVMIYINGVLSQTYTNLASKTSNYNSVWIGRDSRTTQPTNVQFGGTIYNVRIYDDALTENQIVYNSRQDGTYGT